MSDRRASAPPRPGEAQTVSVGDTTYIWYVGFTNFLNKIGTLSLLSFFFWIGFSYFVGATTLVVGWTYGPRIDGSLVCPANSHIWTVVGMWYTMALVSVVTAYGFSTVETLDKNVFQDATPYIKWVGFFVKVVPTWTRLLHIFNYGQLNVVGMQLLFLPECNKQILVIIYSVALSIWLWIVVFGVYAKSRIFVPPFLYSPIIPGRGIVVDLHKMMRSLGP
eukprot:GHVN01036270.1.p1 GENE.GHVN01036270.1~~GHVN01036270.1.p1  ORF type:complete len:220 (+),score=8.82 GHVN01036270.1:109-768(+)